MLNKINSRFHFSCLALLLAVILTYSNHFNNSFHFDDSHTIENNVFIRDLKHIPKFFTDATTFSSNPANQSYRPVVSATLAVGYWLSGDGSPFFFHLQNFWGLFLYTLLFFFFALKIFNAFHPSPSNRYLALFSAALFSLHPLTAETVNYIISRSDILSSVGVMAGMVIWLYFPQKRKFGFYLFPVIIGMLAKPSAAMFAPILFFTEWLMNKKESGSKSTIKSRENSGFRFAQQFINPTISALPAFIVCGLLYLFIDHMTPKTWVAGGTSLWNYLITQPYVILLYLRNTILPTHLTADTDLSAFSSLADMKVILGFIVVLSILAALIFRLKDKKWIPFVLGMTWFLLALLPTSVIPLAEVMNDHRMFFPLPGLIMALVWSVHIKYDNLLKRAGKLIPALCLLLLAALAYGTHQRNKVWATEETLWKDVTEKSPRNGRGLMNYGLTLMAKGDLNGALGYFNEAKQFTPSYSILFVNIAIANHSLGNMAEAENNFRIALDLAPNNPECNFYYARFLFLTNRIPQAKPYLLKTLTLSPAHLGANKLVLQIDAAEKNLALAPTPEYFLNLSLQFYHEKKFVECIDACRKALQLKPNYPEAYNNICSAYNDLKEYERAMHACDSALKLNPSFTLAKNNFDYAKSMLKKK